MVGLMGRLSVIWHSQLARILDGCMDILRTTTTSKIIYPGHRKEEDGGSSCRIVGQRPRDPHELWRVKICMYEVALNWSWSRKDDDAVGWKCVGKTLAIEFCTE